jgi:flagellar biosynthesis protein FlhB
MSGEKTEEATNKKIEDSIKQGQVAISKDVQTLAKLIAFYAVFFYFIMEFSGKVSNYFDSLFVLIFKKNIDFDAIISMSVDLFFVLTFPLVIVCVLFSMISTWMQIGFVYSPEAIIPSFKKFDFVQNIKQMFSKKSLVQLLVAFVKVVVLMIVSWLVLLDSLETITLSYRAGLDAFLEILLSLLKLVLFFSFLVFVLLSLIDWFAVFIDHKKNIRMSKTEIKDENKQQYGDPGIKRKRKQLHRNLINSSLSNVSKAKAVVTNPTHIAVALDYEVGVHDLPFILSMGEDEEAILIKSEAAKHGIPIIENVVLARRLYADCEEEEYIQEQHLEMVAELFRLVLRLK